MEVEERRYLVLSIPKTYTPLWSDLGQALPTLRRPQVRHVALWVWGLLRARHCAWGRVADELPITGTKASRIRRLKQWLMHSRIAVDTISGPLVQRTLQRWHRPELTLVLERTKWGVFHVVLVGVAVLGRVVPLAWTLLSHHGSAEFQEQQALWERIHPWWPAAPQKAVLGDEECKSGEWMRSTQRLGWDFGLGQSADTRFQGPDGT